ncbi:MAG: peptide chain release factor N(5)-glutamine methyltransferase [Oscillospiraceae bacterium]|nr:peptide chain release factor N(5)-glutamine methyltransferase [Oscillospiraceae bacterium]
MVKTYGELFLDARRALLQSEGENAALAAQELLSLASGKTPAALIADRSLYASEDVVHAVENGVKRLLCGEPLAYIIGQWSFYGMNLTVTPDVLIPRDDTMAVTDLAIELLKSVTPPQRVLDLCTGSGCIGLAIAKHIPSARLTLADLSQEALRVAKKNAADLHLTGRVNCMQADARKPLPPFFGQFDLIVSNPPYITKQEMTELPTSVRAYEPHMALDGGEDGLDFYREICKNTLLSLKDCGWLCLEFGMGQERAIEQILRDAGLVNMEFRKDLRGVVRAVKAQKV